MEASAGTMTHAMQAVLPLDVTTSHEQGCTASRAGARPTCPSSSSSTSTMLPLLTTILLHGATARLTSPNCSSWAASVGDDEVETADVVGDVCSVPSREGAQLVAAASSGLRAGQPPTLVADGMGGTYLVRGPDGAPVGMLKPADEEPLAPNNPRGNVGSVMGGTGLKPSVRVGEAAVREVAASLLDHGRFAGVPASALVRARHPTFCYNSRGLGDVRVASGVWSSGDAAATSPLPPASQRALPMKLGSLQAYVPHECDANEMGPASFAVADVHRIGILDVRLFNTDRHAGNMLVRRRSDADAATAGSRYELIPIDHGFCLPEALDAPYFEWLPWPQAKEPFSEDELEYIRGLDAAADAATLRASLPRVRPGSLRVLELSTALLKRCAEAGMTLHEIGALLTRPFDSDAGTEQPSPLETMCLQAKVSPLADQRALLAHLPPSALPLAAQLAAGAPSSAAPQSDCSERLGAHTHSAPPPTAGQLWGACGLCGGEHAVPADLAWLAGGTLGAALRGLGLAGTRVDGDDDALLSKGIPHHHAASEAPRLWRELRGVLQQQGAADPATGDERGGCCAPPSAAPTAPPPAELAQEERARCAGACCAGGPFDVCRSWDTFSEASWRWFSMHVLLHLEMGLGARGDAMSSALDARQAVA